MFFSPGLDHSTYAEEIDQALASATCLVVVASQPRHLDKNWPEYEYRLFHVMMRNDKKPKRAQLVSYISGFHHADLPPPLPYYHAVMSKRMRDERAIDELMKYVIVSAR